MSKSSRVYSLVMESGDLERSPHSWSHILIIRDQYGNDHGWTQFGVARLEQGDILRPESDAIYDLELVVFALEKYPG